MLRSANESATYRTGVGSPGTPICTVFGCVSRTCPDTDKLTCFLCPSAAVCLRICGQKLAQSFSVYTKKSLAAGTQLQTLMGAHDAPPSPQVGPRRLVPAPLSRIAVPRLWSSYREERRCDKMPSHVINVQTVTDGIGRRVQSGQQYIV